ncbi:MAG TPA: trypsin-like peptidase domain-containing protein [Actinomycetales bacterium]|jgi:putative serine protease PepD
MSTSQPPGQEPSWWSPTAPPDDTDRHHGDATGRDETLPHDPGQHPDTLPAGWQQPGDSLGGTVASRPARPVGLLLAGAVVLALVAGLLGGAAGAWWQDRSSGGTDRSVSLPAPTPGSTARRTDTVAGVARTVLPSVVAIKVAGADGAGTGSGFVIRSDGYIVTNNHVVAAAAGAGSITVVFQDGSQAPATVVGRDESYDLAAIKVSRTDLASLDFGDSASVVVGDEVVAIGAPLGLQGTVTTGIVSALNRPVTAGGEEGSPAFINAIQTDAAINPGNSGGPLVNMAGQVVAVNSAIARVPGAGSLGQSGNIGLGFAIPSLQARRTVEQLIRTGKAQHPVIGVLLDRRYTGEGVRVASEPQGGQPPITPGGAADEAGIEPGDVITAFEGRPVAEPDELVVAIRARAPGETVRLTVERDGREREVTMTLQASVD